MSIDVRALQEIGEWAAAGFYEALDQPWPRSYGMALRRLYENIPIRVPADKLLIPCDPFPVRDVPLRGGGGSWAPELLCDFRHSSGLVFNIGLIEEKKAAYPRHAEMLDELARDLPSHLHHFGGYTHSNPDIRRVVHEGFLSMERELDEQIEWVRGRGDDGQPEELNLLLALKDYAAGVRAFHARTHAALREASRLADGSRRDRLTWIADAFEQGFLHPARSFVAGLLAVNFTWLLDECDSIGRFDQALGSLYEQDTASGTLDVAFARELLDELWHNFERMNGWNMQIGGYTPDGKDGANALTMECMEACRRNALRRPNVALRITRHTPDAVLVRALDVLSSGSGRPALYNDDLYVTTLHGMQLGLTPEDAREIGFGGCTETMIAGQSNVGSLEGCLNLAKALELALHDGLDPVSGVQAGPHTGLFESFVDNDAFLAAVKRQIQYMTDAFVSANRVALQQRFTQGDPKIYRTMFTRDCVKNRRSFEAGGARYNWAVVSYHGIANLIDSLTAIRAFVFDEQSVTPAQLLEALSTNFAGHDNLRRKLQSAPRFGNDNDASDRTGQDIMQYAWETLYAHETPRGGRYIPSCILFVTYAGAGKAVGALPDGRRAFEPLTDSVGPVQGRDTHGPTAMLRSVTRLPLWMAAGTPVLNIRLQKAMLRKRNGLEAAAALVRSFFAEGGMQIQVSVIDKQEMLDAQADPEHHQDLIVRIGGYSEYFTKLDRVLQDSVIVRTEHTV